MSFGFNSAIPAGGDNPSASQPLMLQNNISTAGIIAVDHVGFGTAMGGTHKQVTFPAAIVPPTPISGISVAFPNLPSGTASPAPQVVFINSNPASASPGSGASFILSCVKAFGVFDPSSPPVTTFLNSMNVTISGSNPYTITTAANAVIGNNAIIIVNQSNFTCTYSFTNPTLTLMVAQSRGPVSFVILQN